MNINSGGPHILLFERDQQLTTLLASELQLAGYECHPARTAVEVFDAIARFPVRMVLVNLAQAAASRREFWVALDTQRRGRGVQVLTYRCMNIAGYGSDDLDDTSRTVLTDIEVDGMMGIMSLVDAVRSRIPGPVTAGSLAQLAATTGVNAQDARNQNRLNKQTERMDSGRMPQAAAQTTTSYSTSPTNPSLATPSAPHAPSLGTINSVGTIRPGSPTSGFTDKIRAVIYPNNRNFSPIPESNPVAYLPQNPAATQQVVGTQSRPIRPQETPGSRESAVPPLSNGMGTQRQSSQTISRPTESTSRSFERQEQESGLAQLSRMVQESHVAEPDEPADLNIIKRPTSPLSEQGVQQVRPQAAQIQNDEVHAHPENTKSQQTRSSDTNVLNAITLRASPIQDIPLEREQEYRNSYVGTAATQSENAAPGAATISTISPASLSEQKTTSIPREAISSSEAGPQTIAKEEVIITEPGAEVAIALALAGMPQMSLSQTQKQSLSTDATSDDTLLDIVQSLPPMSSLPAPSSQPNTPVLSGRATRSLGSVLLDGNLVPQHRLEVAQNIQRMLRGVDMNYQLGEILLMFKLLTPDQLLAASLVSYGLISTAQISALGRIRQELHAIGLEYDLESLLVLFRILTPEQLREVRASWIA